MSAVTSRNGFGERLGDEHPVERVTMMAGKLINHRRMGGRDRKQCHSGNAEFMHGRLPRNVEHWLANAKQRMLDCDFPDARCTDEEFDRRIRKHYRETLGQQFSIEDLPKGDMGIEQHPQSLTPNNGATSASSSGSIGPIT